TLAVWHNLDSTAFVKDYSIRNYKIGNSITEIKEDSLENIYLFHKKKLLIIDSLGIDNVPQLHLDYVILRNSPRINLARLLDSIKPELIIADGSNYNSYLQRWEETCLKQNVPFHLTSREGAFVFKKE
ncbi:MAG: ComEC family competence protein, partial [Gelidibacter sp.]